MGGRRPPVLGRDLTPLRGQRARPLVRSYGFARACACWISAWAWPIQVFTSDCFSACPSNVAAPSAVLILVATSSRWLVSVWMVFSIEVYVASLPDVPLASALVDDVSRSSPNWPNGAFSCS